MVIKYTAMKKIYIPILLSTLLFLTGCKEPIMDSHPLFFFNLDIHLSNYSDDILVKSDKGRMEKITFNDAENIVSFRFNDPESTFPKGSLIQEYVFTLSSNSTLSKYPDGYNIKVVTNDRWTGVDKIYNNEGEEIPFIVDPVNAYKLSIQIDNSN